MKDPRKTDSYEFMYTLAVQLMLPFIQQRNLHSKYLTSDVKRHISNVLQNNSQHVLDLNQNQPGVVDQNVAAQGWFHLNNYYVFSILIVSICCRSSWSGWSR